MPLIDFPPWLQTALTLLGTVAIVLFVGVIPRVAKARLKVDPKDEWGLRLAMVGVFLKEASRSKLVLALPLPPLLRLALESIPGSDPPVARCARVMGCARPDGHEGRCLVIDDPESTHRGEP